MYGYPNTASSGGMTLRHRVYTDPQSLPRGLASLSQPDNIRFIAFCPFPVSLPPPLEWFLESPLREITYTQIHVSGSRSGESKTRNLCSAFYVTKTRHCNLKKILFHRKKSRYCLLLKQMLGNSACFNLELIAHKFIYILSKSGSFSF